MNFCKVKRNAHPMREKRMSGSIFSLGHYSVIGRIYIWLTLICFYPVSWKCFPTTLGAGKMYQKPNFTGNTVKLDLLVMYHAQSISIIAWWTHNLYFFCCDFILYFKLLRSNIWDTECSQELEESWPNLRQRPPSQNFSRTWDLNWGVWIPRAQAS